MPPSENRCGDQNDRKLSGERYRMRVLLHAASGVRLRQKNPLNPDRWINRRVFRLFSPARLCRNTRNHLDVMLSPSVGLRINSAKHVLFQRLTKNQILRLRLRMTF
jgi:hypothetical protein